MASSLRAIMVKETAAIMGMPHTEGGPDSFRK
jgi:hypothetical protein